MNLLDFRTTSLWLVWEAVRAEAAEDDVELAESELIGLAPLASLLDVATHAGIPADRPTAERLAGAADFLKAARLLAAASPGAAPGRGSRHIAE